MLLLLLWMKTYLFTHSLFPMLSALLNSILVVGVFQDKTSVTHLEGIHSCLSITPTRVLFQDFIIWLHWLYRQLTVIIHIVSLGIIRLSETPRLPYHVTCESWEFYGIIFFCFCPSPGLTVRVFYVSFFLFSQFHCCSRLYFLLKDHSDLKDVLWPHFLPFLTHLLQMRFYCDACHLVFCLRT